MPAGAAERLEWTRTRAAARNGAVAVRHRAKLVALLGEDRGRAAKYAEAFEVCEYGTRPTEDGLKQLFPFFGEE